MTEENGILVVGLGSEILSDDGIPLKLIDDLKENFQSQKICFKTTFVGGLEMMEMIAGFNKLVIIDTMKNNGHPGKVNSYYGLIIPPSIHLNNVHDVDFLSILKMAKKLGIKIPESYLFITVEIAEDKLFGTQLSDLLSIEYPQVLKKTQQLIINFIKEKVVNN